ncbi:enoyl-CoA hydratase/isomerase family protein [Wenyingzhuangia aestuarii]|uniref:enoyl-CoA hydratase/isomerase family protein n=1 Tax=Wenyingzhuangia aestuarii TaxID=1647582 RepID=UPI00143B07B3|nr:enoyl-CoA hydratase-related protein [Wenyingzhuangia aestuarii]NJB81615.1 enoyl-CoA hydratase [Wenyingzhuangia aestuarii]
MADSKEVIVSVKDKIALITINAPKRLNALNRKIIKELHQCLYDLKYDANVRVVVITGAGEKAFVAGADIKEFASFSRKQGKELAQSGHDLLFNKIANYSKPVIAAVNGFALGGGLELAMACHMRVATTNAKLGQPEVSLGLIPGYGGTQRLTQLIGKGKAFEMILTGDMITAEEGLKLGLLNYVVAQEELLPKAFEIANKTIKNSPEALRKSIKAINGVFGNIGLQNEVELFGQCFGTSEFKEGTQAFLEKRKPNFD